MTRVEKYSDKYHDLIYFITDGENEFEVYQGKGLEGADFTSADDLQDGDEVIVYGKLTKYKTTYEFAKGSKLYSLNGQTAGIGGVTYTPATRNACLYTLWCQGDKHRGSQAWRIRCRRTEKIRKVI